jgi:alkylhydroperoxidase family enzyme
MVNNPSGRCAWCQVEHDRRSLYCSDICRDRAYRSRPEVDARRKAQLKVWRESPQGRAWKRTNLLSQYGLTVEQYDTILVAQGGGCALCGKKRGSLKGTKPLHVDHHHASGAVRGLLCDYCNRHRLGRGREDAEMHRRIADYLEQGAARVRTLIGGEPWVSE